MASNPCACAALFSVHMLGAWSGLALCLVRTHQHGHHVLRAASSAVSACGGQIRCTVRYRPDNPHTKCYCADQSHHLGDWRVACVCVACVRVACVRCVCGLGACRLCGSASAAHLWTASVCLPLCLSALSCVPHTMTVLFSPRASLWDPPIRCYQAGGASTTSTQRCSTTGFTAGSFTVRITRTPCCLSTALMCPLPPRP